jgi:hypothetical protein
VVLLGALLVASPQVFAAAAPKLRPEKATHPLNWSCGGLSSGHCYGVQAWGGANGADTRISLDTNLSGGASSNDWNNWSFVTTELWLSNGTYWVEVGVISEYREFNSTYPYYFWADQRPNGGGFSFHYWTYIPGSGQTPLFRITRINSSQWSVLVRDNTYSYTGTSTYNQFTPSSIQIGTELYNNFNTAHEGNTYYTNNRWENNGTWWYQGNDGVWTNIIYPAWGDWYNGQDPLNNNTGGVWYTCIQGAGC